MNENQTYGEQLRNALLAQMSPYERTWHEANWKEEEALNKVRLIADLRYRFPQELRDEIEDLTTRLKLAVQEDPPDLDEARRLLDEIHDLEMRLKMILQKPQTPLSQKMNKNLTLGQRKFEMMRKSSFGDGSK